VRAFLPLSLLALALAVGCGQKGPLVHPNRHAKTPVATDPNGATPAPARAAAGPDAVPPAAPEPGAAPPRDPADAPAATPRG